MGAPFPPRWTQPGDAQRDVALLHSLFVSVADAPPGGPPAATIVPPPPPPPPSSGHHLLDFDLDRLFPASSSSSSSEPGPTLSRQQCADIERFLRRVAAHPVLRETPAWTAFLTRPGTHWAAAPLPAPAPEDPGDPDPVLLEQENSLSDRETPREEDAFSPWSSSRPRRDRTSFSSSFSSSTPPPDRDDLHAAQQHWATLLAQLNATQRALASHRNNAAASRFSSLGLPDCPPDPFAPQMDLPPSDDLVSDYLALADAMAHLAQWENGMAPALLRFSQGLRSMASIWADVALRVDRCARAVGAVARLTRAASDAATRTVRAGEKMEKRRAALSHAKNEGAARIRRPAQDNVGGVGIPSFLQKTLGWDQNSAASASSTTTPTRLWSAATWWPPTRFSGSIAIPQTNDQVKELEERVAAETHIWEGRARQLVGCEAEWVRRDRQLEIKLALSDWVGGEVEGAQQAVEMWDQILSVLLAPPGGGGDWFDPSDGWQAADEADPLTDPSHLVSPGDPLSTYAAAAGGSATGGLRDLGHSPVAPLVLAEEATPW